MIQKYLVATVLFGVILRANAFSYKDAKNWGKKYPLCKGKHQSPIFTREQFLSPYPTIEGLTLINFNKLPTNMTIKNTGRTVELRAKWSGVPPKVTGDPLKAKYVFEKITFHWSQKPWTVKMDEEHYKVDMEMHMFFYREDLKSFEKAESQKKGLVAIRSVLRSEYVTPLHVFDDLEKNLHKVRSQNSTTEIKPFELNNTFNSRVVPFAFYDGSLDYPPCTESVTWFVDDDGDSITKKLIKEFRKIKLDEGDVSNIRPDQARNKRVIKRVFGDNASPE